MKYLYSIFVVVLNYLFAFLTVPIVFNFFVKDLNIINKNTLFLVVNFLNALFVLLLGLLFYRHYKQSHLERYNAKNIGFINLIAIVIFPTIVFFMYKYFTSQIDIHYNNINITDFILYQFAYIAFIPFTEEFIYREILYKILIKENIFYVSIFISILFTMTHIGLDKFDLIYLLYIFFNGMVLFYVRYKKNLSFAMISHAIINTIVIYFT